MSGGDHVLPELDQDRDPTGSLTPWVYPRHFVLGCRPSSPPLLFWQCSRGTDGGGVMVVAATDPRLPPAPTCCRPHDRATIFSPLQFLPPPPSFLRQGRSASIRRRASPASPLNSPFGHFEAPLWRLDVVRTQARPRATTALGQRALPVRVDARAPSPPFLLPSHPAPRVVRTAASFMGGAPARMTNHINCFNPRPRAWACAALLVTRPRGVCGGGGGVPGLPRVGINLYYD